LSIIHLTRADTLSRVITIRARNSISTAQVFGFAAAYFAAAGAAVGRHGASFVPTAPAI